MAEFILNKDQKAFAFDPTIPPALTIASGDTVTFETGDFAYERLANGEKVEDIGLENFNAVTGPVYVEGAEPGDALKIDILDVQVVRAWSVWLPGFGGLGGKTTDAHVMQTPLRDGRAYLSETVSVPIEAMIGCIGVAPKAGKASTFMPAYFHGGNFDLREMMAGTTLYLPVQVPGGLLAMGDLHAAMGTAEPTWVSLEAAGSATLRISVEKGMALNYPRLRVDGATICLGMGETLQEAHQIALDQAFDLLVKDFKLEPFVAYAYASARVGMRFGGPASPIVLAVVPDVDA
jgi:amidase